MLALAVSCCLGIGLGCAAALRRGGLIDRAIGLSAALTLSLPSFVVAPLLQIAFGLTLRWLPLSGWEDGDPRHLVLPVATLALPQVGALARLTRASLGEVLRTQPIRTMRAFGLPPGRVVRHALRGALLPVVAYLGPLAAALLTGSVVVETIFGLPGIGRYFVEGALNRDYTLVMGVVLLVAALVIVLNLAADLACAWLDPRLRTDGGLPRRPCPDGSCAGPLLSRPPPVAGRADTAAGCGASHTRPEPHRVPHACPGGRGGSRRR